MRRVRRSGRTAERRPTPSRSASLLLCLSPRRLTRADTTTASASRAASTSFLDRAVDLVERAPIVSSCAACAVPDAPPSADRRHHVQLRCCSAYRRAGSLEPTRRRRARAEPRARRSLIAPSTSSSARRSCRRAPRAPFRTHRRAPTDAHHVQLRCCSAYRRAGSLEPTRRRRARAEPRVSRSLIAPSTSSSARRSCRRAPRAPFRTHRRAPTDAITFSFVAELCLSPRRLTRADTTTASARRAASTSFLDRAVDLVERAPIVSSCAACAVPDAPPSADRRHHVQLRCCSAYRRAGSLEPTRRRRARAEPRARRSLIAPSTSSSARRSCRRAPRAPFRTHRRAPTDAITFSFVAALPIAAPAHSSRHDDGERAPSREHVVP